MFPDDSEESDLAGGDGGLDRGPPSLVAAAWLSIVYGLVSAAALTVTLRFLMVRGRPPVVLGIRWSAGGPLEAGGIEVWRIGVAVAIVLSLLDVVIGVLLRRGRRSGGYLTVFKFPFDMAFAIGVGGAPGPLLVYPIRLALVVVNWSYLAGQKRELGVRRRRGG